ncbi:ninjurin-2-like isoform X1 [Brachionus plicatilis]|uniref:Ninjurin-2-like isoform X1 n=1 Tax=Brachionus plicatilis TaxID=10195 RepID=A0A3M7QJL1_BRAPC|nr:ninjurin-2-like isoform X1 [Brachionus plicatilis]
MAFSKETIQDEEFVDMSQKQETEQDKNNKNDDKFFNIYATKKTFSNGLMDGALLAANAAQLRLLLTDGFIYPKDPKWIISITLVIASIISQCVIFIILAYLAKNNLANKAKKPYLDAMNNVVLILTGIIFCLNVITNVFIQIDFTNILGSTVSNIPTFEWPTTNPS